MGITVHKRIAEKRPKIRNRDVIAAFAASVRHMPRLGTDPTQWVGAGYDSNGRLLEYVAVAIGPDDWLIYHAMPITTKVRLELNL